MKNMKILPLSKEYYHLYWSECQKLSMPPLFLPKVYSTSLWGMIVLENDRLIGGWVGKLRGDKTILRYFLKGVWFDSLPLLFENNQNGWLYNEIISSTKKQAKIDGMVSLNITHWARQISPIKGVFSIEENNATYIVDLKSDIDVLWANVESKLRKRTINKAIKNNVDVVEVHGDEAIIYLEKFQQLRQETQGRALSNNSNASMLLKSNHFFTIIIQNYNASFFIAKYENEIISMALMIACGRTMYYYMGGSEINANRKTGASSFLFWKIIESAKNANLDFLDFGGVPINPDESHPAYGVFTFKKSFGGVYKEFNSGKIIIRKRLYPIINFIFKNRVILRILSKIE